MFALVVRREVNFWWLEEVDKLSFEYNSNGKFFILRNTMPETQSTAGVQIDHIGPHLSWSTLLSGNLPPLLASPWGTIATAGGQFNHSSSGEHILLHPAAVAALQETASNNWSVFVDDVYVDDVTASNHLTWWNHTPQTALGGLTPFESAFGTLGGLTPDQVAVGGGTEPEPEPEPKVA